VYHGTYVLIMLCTMVRTCDILVRTFKCTYTCSTRDTFNGDTNHHWLLLLVDP
jgi:hypothetical protein